MTSNLASDEIAQHALQLRKEAKQIRDKRLEGKIGTNQFIYRVFIKLWMFMNKIFYAPQFAAIFYHKYYHIMHMIVSVWREPIVAYLMYCPSIHLDKMRKSTEIFRIAGSPARFISNTCVVYGPCTNLLGTYSIYSLLFMLCMCRIIKIWKCGQSVALHINKSVIGFKICNCIVDMCNWETYFCVS